MCEYCEGKKFMVKPVIEEYIHPVNLFEHPPVSYGRYGEYPRDLRPVNVINHKTEIVFDCPMCGRKLED
ncbi:MAG: hypothetical protein H8D23_41165 [Candidatus Brocadiales bacterium]|nr:hypothetical protein [Candidatus Brocadiales bacterium]